VTGLVNLRQDLDMAEIFPGISMDPNVRFGKPCIAGTRVDVATIIAALAEGDGISAVAEELRLSELQVRAALRYAAHVADHQPPAVKEHA
jgi:uncharacterized protein (DUF433 family)